MTKHPGGRPSEYDPIFISELEAYTAVPPADEELPTVEGFAYKIGVSKKTVYTWAEAHSEFLHALDRMKDRQAVLLQNKGLAGKFAPVITKLMLSANHGMAEKTESKDTLKAEVIHSSADKAIAEIDSSLKRG